MFYLEMDNCIIVYMKMGYSTLLLYLTIADNMLLYYPMLSKFKIYFISDTENNYNLYWQYFIWQLTELFNLTGH